MIVFELKMVPSFLNNLEEINIRDKDQDEWKSAELKRCLAALGGSRSTVLRGGCWSPEPGRL